MGVIPVQAGAVGDGKAIVSLCARRDRVQAAAVVGLVHGQAVPVRRGVFVQFVVERQVEALALAQAQERVDDGPAVVAAGVVPQCRRAAGEDRKFSDGGAQLPRRGQRQIGQQAVGPGHAQRSGEMFVSSIVCGLGGGCGQCGRRLRGAVFASRQPPGATRHGHCAQAHQHAASGLADFAAHDGVLILVCCLSDLADTHGSSMRQHVDTDASLPRERHRGVTHSG